ncbi:hypothetical protein BB560_004339 [Smittium megazygosporum]|uniref:Glucose-6-phosphate 1-epimerase n=1 Tax=Smittium megazygosporum TaxID=133381 RepID=A0A2T9Z9I7_9FUNG|nr:hypothetical protein BB560_004339 [Smittium megazygosporum]
MPITTVKDSQGNITKVVLVEASGAAVEVYLYGATITSWKAKGKERLFLSKQAILDGSKAIRGGIPIVFPQFGLGKLVQHGFARTSNWQLLGYKDQIDGAKAMFLLTENEHSLSMWPHKFRAVYTIRLDSDTLNLSLSITNTNTSAAGSFDFTTLLHTYFLTPSISEVAVHNLAGLSYTDKVAKLDNVVEKNDPVSLASNVDRVYHNAPEKINIDISKHEAVLLTKTNFKDIVLWNPWAELAKGMADFGDDEYKQMVCVETGTVGSPISLAPGQTWEGHTSIVLQ